jgi:hypothetical protein
MTNDEIRRNGEIRMTKPATAQLRVFDIRASDFFRHSSFVIQRLVQGGFTVQGVRKNERRLSMITYQTGTVPDFDTVIEL